MSRTTPLETLGQRRVKWGAAANFVLQTGHQMLDELLTRQKFWSADLGTRAVAAGPGAVRAALVDLSDSKYTTRAFSVDNVSYHVNDKPHCIVFQAVYESV